MLNHERNPLVEKLPSAVTLLGAGLTVRGLLDINNGKADQAARNLLIGRCMDLLDGYLARRLGVANEQGKKLDATTDKVLMAAALPILWRNSILSDAEAAALIGQNGLSATAALIAKSRGIDESISVSKLGKRSTFAEWAGVGLGIMAETEWAAQTDRQQMLDQAKKWAVWGGVAIGAVASANYLRQALK